MTAIVPIIRAYTRANPPADDASLKKYNQTQFTSLQDAISDVVQFSAPGEYSAAGGRLSPVSATPFFQGNGTGYTTLYYTPAVHDVIPIWNGKNFVPRQFTELSASVASLAATSLYDYFVWMNGTTLTLSAGPAWQTFAWGGCVRGASTAIVQVNGVYVNQVAITGGPPAGYGTYVGTLMTNSTGGQYNLSPLNQSGSGGAVCDIGIWNTYNRRPIVASVLDTSAGYNYVTVAWRICHAAANLQIRYVNGLGIEGFTAVARQGTQPPATAGAYTGLGVAQAVSGTLTNITTITPFAWTTGQPSLPYMVPAVYAITAAGANYIAPTETAGSGSWTLVNPSIQAQLFQ